MLRDNLLEIRDLDALVTFQRIERRIEFFLVVCTSILETLDMPRRATTTRTEFPIVVARVIAFLELSVSRPLRLP